MPTESEFIVALDKLGQTSDIIAQSLSSLGIKGQVCISCKCPISNYLKQEFRIEGDVAVSSKQVSFCPKGPVLFQNYNVPENVSEFIRNFDSSCYPELVEPHTRGC